MSLRKLVTIELTEREAIDASIFMAETFSLLAHTSGKETALRMILGNLAGINNVLSNVCGVEDTAALLRSMADDIEASANSPEHISVVKANGTYEVRRTTEPKH